jgi:hypothetical protein
VIVHCTPSYFVVNNGEALESYRPFLAQEGMYNPEASHLEYGTNAFESARIKMSRASTGVVSFSPPDEYPEYVLLPSEAGTAIENLSGDQKCFVRWQFSVVMPDYYSDVVAFGGVTINPIIEVASTPEGFEFNATEEKCAHDPGGRTWRYQRAFIEGQHVRVWWRRISDSITSDPQPSDLHRV